MAIMSWASDRVNLVNPEIKKGIGIDSCVYTFAVKAETEVQRYTDPAACKH